MSIGREKMSTNEKNTNQDQNGIDESTTQDTKQWSQRMHQRMM